MSSGVNELSQDACVQYIPITAVKNTDVLCGRGGTINTHPGNEAFRVLVNSQKRIYLTARFKREKKIIAQSIVDEVRKTGGRFLCRKEVPRRGRRKIVEEEMWFEVNDEKARYKTSQALRENAPKIRLAIENEKEGASAEAVGDDDDYEEKVIVDFDDDKTSKTTDKVKKVEAVDSFGATSLWDDLPNMSRSFSTIIQNQWNSVVGEDSATAPHHNHDKISSQPQSGSVTSPGNHRGRSVHFVPGVKFSLDEDEMARRGNVTDHYQEKQCSQNMQQQQNHQQDCHTGIGDHRCSYPSVVYSTPMQTPCTHFPKNNGADHFVPENISSGNIFNPAVAQQKPSFNHEQPTVSLQCLPKGNNTLPLNMNYRRPPSSPIRSRSTRSNPLSTRQPSWKSQRQEMPNHNYNPNVEMVDADTSIVPYNDPSSKQETLSTPARIRNHSQQQVHMNSKALVEEQSTKMENRAEDDAQRRGCEAWVNHDWNLPSYCCGNLADVASHDSHDMVHMEIGSTGSIGGASLCHVFDEKRNSFSDRSMEGAKARVQQRFPLLRNNSTRSADMLPSKLSWKPSDVGSLGSDISIKSPNSMTMIAEAEHPADITVSIDLMPLQTWSYDSKKVTE